MLPLVFSAGLLKSSRVGPTGTLEELGEFSPLVLDALRQPLEERVVRIARQGAAVAFPADFLLIACSNPCPCGLGPPRCICSEALRLRYRRRLSAPLIDRFDLRVALGPAAPGDPTGAPSHEMRERVREAIARQRRRYRHFPWRRNALVPASTLTRAVPLNRDAEETLRQAAYRRELSGRGLACTHRVARTLADLAGTETISPEHVLLAASLREDVL
ncbi:MAG: ATP-binding protein [Actinomycetota bacterium]